MNQHIILADPPLGRWMLLPEGEEFEGWSIQKNARRKFIIKRLLGVGGKGAVFRAISVGRPSRTVVLKFPTYDFTYFSDESTLNQVFERLDSHFKIQDAEYMSEYINATTLLSQCRSANLTEDLIIYRYVYNVGPRSHQKPVHIQVGVQEFLDPEVWCSLDDLILQSFKTPKLELTELPNWPITFPQWLKLAKGISRALADIHDKRVVHGDIWSPNIFLRSHTNKLGNEGDVRIIDFGNSWSPEFVNAQMGGKRKDSYAPPEERLALLPKSEASDAFSFGVLLLWLLTGPDLKTNSELDSNTRESLLLSYLRRKAFDQQIRMLGEIEMRDRSKEDRYLFQSKLTDGLLNEQLNTLMILYPSGNNQLDKLLQSRSVIEADEANLIKFLRSSLTTQYQQLRKTDDPQVAARVDEDLRKWTEFGLIKKRLYRPWETAVYDPGQVSIEGASNQRTHLREKLWLSPARSFYFENPWIVDIISHCVANDQARRPRIMDVTRELETYSSVRLALDPLQSVSKHRYKVLNLPISKKGFDTEPIDLKESRDILIEYMCVCFRALKRGDIYAAVTTLDLWQGQALGHDGRFLTANLEALRAGVSIRRIFVVSLDELGARFAVKLLVALARRIGLIDETAGFRGNAARKIADGLQNVGSPDYVEFSSSNGIDESKRRAFECLFYHLQVAFHDQLRTNIEHESTQDTQKVNERFLSHSEKVASRKRLLSILRGYQLFSKYFKASPSVQGLEGAITINPLQETPARIESLKEGATTPVFDRNLPGLFLGMRLESSLAKAVTLRATCQRMIIQPRMPINDGNEKRKYILMETGARNRMREKAVELPELNRLRIFYGMLPESPAVQAFQNIMYGLDRSHETHGPTYTLPAINLGCLVPDLVEILEQIGDGD